MPFQTLANCWARIGIRSSTFVDDSLFAFKNMQDKARQAKQIKRDLHVLRLSHSLEKTKLDGTLQEAVVL
jgi:hypothetical protein